MLKRRFFCKKVYGVDPLICPECGAKMRIVAFIEEQPVIEENTYALGFTGGTFLFSVAAGSTS